MPAIYSAFLNAKKEQYIKNLLQMKFFSTTSITIVIIVCCFNCSL